MQTIFPAEEVLEFNLWREPLQDPGLRVYAAVHAGEVVGATEYRFLPELNVAMTDFTIIGRAGLGIGRFLYERRHADLVAWAAAHGQQPLGMFAEVFDPARVPGFTFGGVRTMDPFVRREVLSHLGYCRLEFPYVHPSWQGDGAAVTNLDLCFLPFTQGVEALPARLVAGFLTCYYSVLPNKPEPWYAMIEGLRSVERIPLRPL